MKKQEFVRTFLPDSVRDINFAQIDLDITDLSLADVMRNVNKTFPKNTRVRNAMASGQYAVGVLCKSESLYPLSGLLLIITGNDTRFEIVSKNHIVINVQEDDIVDDEHIKVVLDKITRYIITSFRDTIPKFDDFFVRFVYDPYEMESDSDEEDILQTLYKLYK